MVKKSPIFEPLYDYVIVEQMEDGYTARILGRFQKFKAASKEFDTLERLHPLRDYGLVQVIRGVL